jgi:hypothetical protein
MKYNKQTTIYYRDKLRELRDEFAERAAANERRRLALLAAERCAMVEISKDWRYGVKPLKNRVKVTRML